LNLFELFVKIGVDDQASGKLKDIGGKLGNGLKTAAKVGTAAVATAAAGITALTTAAVNNYAEYEQLVGGVQTLFGAGGQSIEEYAKSTGKSVDKVKGEYDKLIRSQEAVISNADRAYRTAGMSVNEYMSTVTSFSASLLQSLGGDTEKAAKYADQAVIDMADNANKMGTSIDMIQNAYQGFAKQNYTMLDNLNTMGALAV
jgi:phage-related protein